uniref:Kinetochore protein SPC25 n=1 Tax=Magallana gigas TaxID=29159 RepID=K1QNK6_MAGGI
MFRFADDKRNKWIGTELKGHLERLDQEQEKKVKHYQDEIGSHENNIKKIQGLAKNNKKALEDQVQRLTDLRQELKILTTQTQSALQQGEQLHSEISNTQQNIHHRNEVSDFSPELDGVQELEEKLNSTNDLRSFIVAIAQPTHIMGIHYIRRS